ncbi:MAG: Rubrerythrin, partial [Candidatus Methanocomedens sp.]
MGNRKKILIKDCEYCEDKLNMGHMALFKINKRKDVVRMEKKEEMLVCALCGYTASGKFVGDICPKCGLTYWRCVNCGYTMTAAMLPDVCPHCEKKCDFVNI